MSDILSRLNEQLDHLGDRVKSALETSRLHLERSRLIGIRSRVAYKLGMLVYKRERGGEVTPAEVEALFARMDDLAEKTARVDREIDAVHGESVSVAEQPAPAAEPAEAEVKEPPTP